MKKTFDFDFGKMEAHKLIEDFCEMLLDRVDEADTFEKVKGLGGLIQALSYVSEKIDADHFFSEYSCWFLELVDAIKIYEAYNSKLDMSSDDLNTLRKFGFIEVESDSNG